MCKSRCISYECAKTGAYHINVQKPVYIISMCKNWCIFSAMTVVVVVVVVVVFVVVVVVLLLLLLLLLLLHFWL